MVHSREAAVLQAEVVQVRNGKYPKVVQSIQDVESRTTGEIHVHLSKAIYEKDPFEGAQRVFARYSMQRTQDRNAILVYINEKKRRFAIIGDLGIHQIVGQKYWNEKSAQLQHYIQTMEMDSALSLIVVDLGKALELHFPLQRDGVSRNQISDEITSDS